MDEQETKIVEEALPPVVEEEQVLLDKTNDENKLLENEGGCAISSDGIEEIPSDDSEVKSSAPEDTTLPVETDTKDPGEELQTSEALSEIYNKCDMLQGDLTKLGGEIHSLQKSIAGYYTQTTDSMHRELEKYRKGLLRKLEQEFLGELIELYDATESAICKAQSDPALALSLLVGLREQIDAALFNRGIEKREAVCGEKFDPRRHHVTKPDVPTGDQALNGTVAVVAKAGFDDMDEAFKDLRDGCMKLRPIWVRLYRYDEALAPVDDTQPQKTEKVETEETIDSL